MSEAPRVKLAELEAAIKNETYTVLPDGKTTICQLTLDNNFTVEGFSACVSIENFDAELGMKYSRERAVSKLWEFMGFRLADKLMREAQPSTFHDAASGRFVSPEYAAANPTTTMELRP